MCLELVVLVVEVRRKRVLFDWWNRWCIVGVRGKMCWWCILDVDVVIGLVYCLVVRCIVLLVLDS